MFSRSKRDETIHSKILMKTFVLLWKEQVLNSKEFASYLMNLTVYLQLSFKKWMLCLHQAKFLDCFKENSICFCSVNINKTIQKEWLQMMKFTKASLKMSKEISMLSSQWIQIILIFQIEQLHPQLYSIDVLLIGLVIGLNKVYYKLLNNLLRLLIQLCNLLKCQFNKMNKGIMLLLIPLLEFIVQWFNWIRS